MKFLRRFAVGVIGLLVLFAILITLPWLLPHSRVAFLTALLTGDERTARQYISPELQDAAEMQCPEGQITACAADLISPTWGELEEVHFAVGSGSRSTVLFHTFWSEHRQPISIILLHDPANENSIIGWRGFVLSESEDADSDLLRGNRTDNQFP